MKETHHWMKYVLEIWNIHDGLLCGHYMEIRISARRRTESGRMNMLDQIVFFLLDQLHDGWNTCFGSVINLCPSIAVRDFCSLFAIRRFSPGIL
jgi:hypothetical protein